jgi:choline dehydrogenase
VSAAITNLAWTGDVPLLAAAPARHRGFSRSPFRGVVASRLARAGHSTLLIESGDDQGANLNATVPALFAAVAEDPKLAWDYYINHYSNETKQQEDGKFVWNTGADLHVGPDPPAGSKPLGIQYVRAVYHRRYKASR